MSVGNLHNVVVWCGRAYPEEEYIQLSSARLDSTRLGCTKKGGERERERVGQQIV